MIHAEFAYALIAGIVPPIIWLFFWLREDSARPEPRSVLTGIFFTGMLAVIVAIPVEQYIATLTDNLTHQYIYWAAVEEFLKFIALGFALRRKSYDEPIDAMVYAMTVAMGFAALENTLFVMRPFAEGALAQGIVFGNMRFIGATLVHLVSSTIIGFTIGLTYYRKTITKVLAWAVGMGIAIAIHSAFNISIIKTSSLDTLRVFAWIWGAVVVLIILFEEVKAVRPRLT